MRPPVIKTYGRILVTPADNFESRAPHVGVQERRAAGLQEVETLPDQRLRGKRTACDENHFKRESVFAEDAGVLSDVKRGRAVKTVEADVQSRRLSRRGLHAQSTRKRGPRFHVR